MVKLPANVYLFMVLVGFAFYYRYKNEGKTKHRKTTLP